MADIRSVLVAAAILVFVATSCGTTATDGALPEGANARSIRVVDGDTLLADISGTQEHVRLIGIDTPETVDPRRPVQCFGKEASRRLHELLPDGTALRLERGAEARDKYGRLLAYVHRADDDLFVNLALVRDGFAVILTIPPNVEFSGEFRAAERDARAANRGLWGACPAPDR